MRPWSRTARYAIVTLALGLGAAACGSSGGTTSSSAGSGSSNAAGGAAGSCSSYKGGEGGVVRVFCDGPAKATVNADGKAATFTGGTCTDAPQGWSANFGVVTGIDFSGTRPDYFGVLSTSSSTLLTSVIDGTAYSVPSATATFTDGKKSFHGEGKVVESGGTLTVDITCG